MFFEAQRRPRRARAPRARGLFVALGLALGFSLGLCASPSRVLAQPLARGEVAGGASAEPDPRAPAGAPDWHPSQPLAARLAFARGRGDGVASGRLPSEVGGDVLTGFAATVVPRDVTEVAAAIHDVNRYHELVPQVVQSQELRRTPRLQDVFVRISVVPLPEFWARLRFREEPTADGGLVIEGRAIEGDLERFTLRWRLTPVDEGRGVLVELWALVLPALPIPLPAGLLSREQERTAARGVAAVRARFTAMASGEPLALRAAPPAAP